MKLVKLEFAEFPKGDRAWILHPVDFGKINLIVGRNASGKTRLLNIIYALATLLSGAKRDPYESGRYRATFDAKDGLATYELHYEDRLILEERYILAGEPVLERGSDGRGTLKAVDVDRLRFETPQNQLAAVLKRDAIQHAFLQELYQWAVSVKHYRFGTTMGADRLFVQEPRFDITPAPDNGTTPPDTLDPNQLFMIYKDGLARFGPAFNDAIIKDLRLLDYHITDIGLDYLQRSELQGVRLPAPPQVIFVQERDLPCKTRQIEMSQGMFRALNLAIQLNYWAQTGNEVCILVDDIGEGLDFDRATRLISLLINKASKHDFQIIMTTNDRFVMNKVPLEYWGVLERRRNKVRVVNQTTSRDTFERFKKIGLNNFDFFARRMYRKQRAK